MATTYLGNEIFLFLREKDTTGSWLKVVCGEELSITLNRSIIERITKCGTLKRAGQLNSEIPFTGVSEFVPAGTEASHNQLLDWQIAGTELDFKFSDASSGGTIVDITGTGSLGDFELLANVDDYIEFSATLSVSGDPVNNL